MRDELARIKKMEWSLPESEAEVGSQSARFLLDARGDVAVDLLKCQQGNPAEQAKLLRLMGQDIGRPFVSRARYSGATPKMVKVHLDRILEILNTQEGTRQAGVTIGHDQVLIVRPYPLRVGVRVGGFFDGDTLRVAYEEGTKDFEFVWKEPESAKPAKVEVVFNSVASVGDMLVVRAKDGEVHRVTFSQEVVLEGDGFEENFQSEGAKPYVIPAGESAEHSAFEFAHAINKGEAGVMATCDGNKVILEQLVCGEMARRDFIEIKAKSCAVSAFDPGQDVTIREVRKDVIALYVTQGAEDVAADYSEAMEQLERADVGLAMRVEGSNVLLSCGSRVKTVVAVSEGEEVEVISVCEEEERASGVHVIEVDQWNQGKLVTMLMEVLPEIPGVLEVFENNTSLIVVSDRDLSLEFCGEWGEVFNEGSDGYDGGFEKLNASILPGEKLHLTHALVFVDRGGQGGDIAKLLMEDGCKQAVLHVNDLPKGVLIDLSSEITVLGKWGVEGVHVHFSEPIPAGMEVEIQLMGVIR